MSWFHLPCPKNIPSPPCFHLPCPKTFLPPTLAAFCIRILGLPRSGIYCQLGDYMVYTALFQHQSTTQKWYILPIGGLYGTYHLLREPRNSIDPVKPSQFWWPWMSRDYMTYQKKTVSKISPTYPWKMPPTFHQQLLKDFFSLFGEVWGIFPGALWAKSVTCLKAPIFCTNTNSMKWFKTEALKSGEFEVARSTM